MDYNGTTGQTTGPSPLLKVMSGDTVSLAVQSFYNTNTATATNTSFSNVLNSLALGIVNTATGGAEGGLANFTINTSPVYLGLQNFINNKDTGRTGTIYYPKAHLNWIFLDDQFTYVSSSSGAIPTASLTYPAGTLNSIAPDAPLTMPRNGYLYIWVSNETQGWDVFFDNLGVQYKTGPVLEENHYYPFGLTMAGISDKADKSNYGENKYRFNKGSELQHQEFADGTGLEMYATNLRELDPQIGRWWQLDFKPSMEESPYASMGNNPIRFNDPLGDTLPMTYSSLQANYPTTGTPEEMYNSVGGDVAGRFNEHKNDVGGNAYENTCALRMSVALNKSGNDIDTDVKNSKGQKMYSEKGSDGKDYVLRKSDLKDYMKGEYGKADISTKSTDKDFDSKVSEIKGQKGIIVYDVTGWTDATGHVTIYDGKGSCGHDCYFPDSDRIKQENARRQAWNEANPDAKQKPMVNVTGVSIWIAK